MLSEERRREIATFLRNRRTRFQPEEVGLPRGVRRRTPGLRREEVAALAGVSTEWYKWMEQARDVRPSAETLRRIARALRLEPGESHHLLTLAGYDWQDRSNGTAHPVAVSPHLQRLIDQFDSCPAWIEGERRDILAWNRAATVVFGDLDAMDTVERNGVYQVFLNPRVRNALVDWERHARTGVGKLRAAYARHVDDPWFNELVRLLSVRSPEFAAWWRDHTIHVTQDGVKAYDLPDAGRVTFDYSVLDVADERFATLRLIVYVPAPGTDTLEKMRVLCGALAER